MFYTYMMTGAIAVICGMFVAVVGILMTISDEKWRYFCLALIGAAVVVLGITAGHYGFNGQYYQNDYEANVGSIPDDVRDFHADQRALPRDRRHYEYDRRTLHQMSAGSLHDPEIATMKASQAQDYFAKRRSLQKRIKRDRSNYHADPSAMAGDRDAIKDDIRDARRDARHPHVCTYRWGRIHWAEKQLKR